MLVLLAYIVLLVFIIGFSWRIWVYMQTPAPLKIPTTPAPIHTSGVVWRMFTEVVLFNSLFKGNKWTWLGGIAFHGALALVLIRHLRYFVNPLPDVFAHLQIFGIIAGLVMVPALLFLLVRRWWVPRTRYISSPADYGVLILLIAIAMSGLAMKFVFRPDIVSIKEAMIGWVTFTGFQTPGDALFAVHFLLVLVLMAIFPFSKLMHAGGIFFSPTRNQADNPREVRHINPWAG
ncbi:MAG: nitrate reductase [Magnetococcales bacterium]|nr:respiratory nitrate reductase subunit gamma [Magnetococcales bacterium]NGZ26475.1 nitrate reductase [Magnetococcales bacterium]